jgi:hypothetical protein
MKMHREKQELLDTPSATGWRVSSLTALRDKNLRDLAAELEQQIHELDHPIAKGPSADR